MTDHTIATEDEWLAARRALLAEEKELTRLRDKLSPQSPRHAVAGGWTRTIASTGRRGET